MLRLPPTRSALRWTQTLRSSRSERRRVVASLLAMTRWQIGAPELLGRRNERYVAHLMDGLVGNERDVAAVEIPWCNAHRTGVIVYSPMRVGLLTVSFAADQVARLDPRDWRRRHPEFLSPRLERNLALRDALRPIAMAHSTTVAAIAVAWTLSWPQVTGAIVGARTPNQVDGWIGSAAITLSEHDLSAIATALAASGAGSGPFGPQQETSGGY